MHRVKRYSLISLYACLSLGHNHEPYRNRWTDRDVFWGVDKDGPRNHVLGGGLDRARERAVLMVWECPIMQPFVRSHWPFVLLSSLSTINTCKCRVLCGGAVTQMSSADMHRAINAQKTAKLDDTQQVCQPPASHSDTTGKLVVIMSYSQYTHTPI